MYWKSLLQGQVRSGLTRDDLASAFSEDDVTLVTKDILLDGQPLGQCASNVHRQGAQEVQTSTVQLVAAFAAVLGTIALFLMSF
jgi:hypothetical protein